MTLYSRRLPAVYIGYIVIAVVAVRQGLHLWPWIWLACTGAVMVYRFTLGRTIEKMKSVEDRIAALPKLVCGFTLNGLTIAPIVPLAFTAPDNVAPLLVGIMLVAGCAVGAASVAGSQRAFVGFCSLPFVLMVVGWAWRGDTLGIALCVGIVTLYLVLFASVRDHGRNLRELMGLVEDNARLSGALEAERDRAEAASEAKTRFFAAASHDLRQPLHALSINATTLEILARRDANPMIRELSQSINRALNQSNSLLDSLLDISNLDANAVQPQLRATDLGALLASVREEFAALAAQKGLALTVDVPTTTTTTAAPALTDPDLLRRILNNLVGNALKFSHTGGVTLGAARAPESDGASAWRVFVSDTGPGIPASEQERVFEEFYQIGNPSRDRSKGLGLGLSIVKRTAALLGAPLQLTSRSGAGTCVELRVMLAEIPQDASADAAEEAADGALETGMLAGLRVLVVDDEAEILNSLQGLLAQLGCEVRCAQDGHAALAWIAHGFAPEVLLMDHRLRDESGTEVIARVCAVLGPVPAVIVTGDTEPATIQLAHAAGHRVIHKPVQGTQLIRALREAIGRSGPPSATA